MASSSTRKQCANNNGCKQAAVTNCEGCSKAFCIKHFTDHRRLLDEEMNIIISEHDHLKHTLNQHTTKPDLHPAIKRVNDWEKKSVQTIHQRAKDLRDELLRSTTAHISDVTRKLQQLSEKLKEGRENDDFIEVDLQRWKKTLDDLKTDFTSPSTISISLRDDVSLVQNISMNSAKITNDVFERASDNRVQIEENGRVAAHNNSVNVTEVRGKNEYGSGRHELRLCVEHSPGIWMFFGINSKSTLLQQQSHESESAYGWSSNNHIWSSGKGEYHDSNARIEMKTKDLISLIFDCDHRKISMINQRTNAKHELIVNLQDCPLPWQLHVNLYEQNSRVRILSN